MSMYSNKPTKIILIRNKNNNQQTTTNARMGSMFLLSVVGRVKISHKLKVYIHLSCVPSTLTGMRAQILFYPVWVRPLESLTRGHPTAGRSNSLRVCPI